MTLNLRTKLATSLTLLLLAFPLSAQETGDAETTEAETTEEAMETDSETGLDMGEVVDDRAPGTLYSDAEHGDWTHRCNVNPEGDDPCHIYQLLQDETGQDTAEVTIIRLPEGLQAAAGVTIVAPLQTLLTQQLTIKIDGGQAKRYPFRYCTTTGCFAQIGLTAAEVSSFKRGGGATLTIVPAGAPDRQVILPLSLTGFTAGFDGLPPTAP